MIELRAAIVGAEEVERRFVDAGPRVRANVRATVQGLGLELQRKVMAEKLSGQVLGVKTGRLRRSINQKTDESGDAISSTTGTNVSYGRAWELGFSGSVQVRAHTRRVASRSTSERYVKDIIDTEDGRGRVKWGRRQASQGIAFVHAHERHVNQPARPFLAPSLEEMRGRIRDRLTAATLGAI